ncbi:MAG: hypothetical protein KJP21_04580, partial [Bacteroidia bacterium]|nr:hypothetical protein [Bacteroidia bacterium]
MHEVIIISNNDSYHVNSVKLRNEVLRQPLGLDIADEDLSDEINQVHFIALDNKTLVGVVILVPHYKPNIGKLRQMATSPQ